jgi:hypothetical protein
MKFIISKFFRAIKAYYTWVCLIAILLTSLPSQSQEISTVGEIYDYEIGDIYHFKFFASSSTQWGSSYTNIEIVDKMYSSGYDTLYYVQDIAFQRIHPNPTLEYYIDTVFYIDLDSLIRMGDIDTVYSIPELYNGRTINTAWYDFWAFDYVNGCGEAEVSYNDGVSVSSSDALVYYKKGEEEWGTPIIVGIRDISSKAPFIALFPNPFNNSTTIEYKLYTKSNIQFTVYNMMGKQVYYLEENSVAPGAHKVTWSPVHLPAGMYYAVLRSGDGVSVVKMVKE